MKKLFHFIYFGFVCLFFFNCKEAKAASEPSLNIMSTGHIVMGTSYPESNPSIPPQDGKTMFEGVKEIFRGGDVIFGNLAAPISDRGFTKKRVDNRNIFAFRSPARYAKYLKEAGFTVVNAANNHILDFGFDAYHDTLKSLDDLGIAHTGRKSDIYKTSINGISLAVYTMTQPYTESFATHHNIAAAAKIIKKLSSENDIVMVGFHGGREGKGSMHTPRGAESLGREYRGEPFKLARTLIDNGADLVVGYGPHIPRGIEIYKGRLIAYSLGNFVTYGPFNLRGPYGLSIILEVKMKKSGEIIFAKAHPLSLVSKTRGLPVFDPNSKIIEHLNWLSKEDFPDTYARFKKDGTIILR